MRTRHLLNAAAWLTESTTTAAEERVMQLHVFTPASYKAEFFWEIE
jgi:hypothetical protein